MYDPLSPLLILMGIIGFIVLLLLILSTLKSEPEPEYGVESVTQKGEEVRSFAEKRIADYFARNNINYVYEKEVRVRGGCLLLSEYVVGNPDFYLPDYDVYVEYWGLVDAPDKRTREQYVHNMKKKMAIYYRNNIKFISIYPRNLENLDWIFRTKFKKVTGTELPS